MKTLPDTLILSPLFCFSKKKLFEEIAESASVLLDVSCESLINALNEGDFATASGLQVEMYDKMEELKALYDSYVKNII